MQERIREGDALSFDAGLCGAGGAWPDTPAAPTSAAPATTKQVRTTRAFRTTSLGIALPPDKNRGPTGAGIVPASRGAMQGGAGRPPRVGGTRPARWHN